jgi:predicted RNA-binding protein with PIN domain
LTGRTHQLRVHFASVGNPICADDLYGFENKFQSIKRQALHASSLEFIHPRTKEKLVLVFDAYLVKDGEGSEFMHDGYKIVYTKADQTADAYIEKMMHELGPDYSIRMVTDDKLLQFSAVHSGVTRMTAKEFFEELTRIGNEITEFVRKLSESKG